jgi:hypothetical protein
MQVHLTKVYRTKQDKAGNQLKTKQGKPYERISIKTQEHGDRWLSGFGASWNEGWNDDDTVNVTVEENGQYLNFSKADPVDELEARVKRLEDKVFGTGPGMKVVPPEGPDDDGIRVDDDDLPF